MRNIKITAAILGVISASTLPAIAGPAGHGGNFGGGQAMQAIAAAPQSGEATAKASSAKKIVQSAASQKDAAPTTSTRLEAQKSAVSTLQSANLPSPTSSAKAQQAAAKLKALQTQQQISVQSLSIANSSTGTVGEVFR